MGQFSHKNINFWHEIVPDLTIGEVDPAARPIALSTELLNETTQSMALEGYLQMPPVIGVDDVLAVRRAMDQLLLAGLPPVYIYVFDQPWRLFQQLSQLVGHFLGDHYALLPNFWAWSIPPTKAASGWPIHRDCDAQTRFENSDFGQTLMSLSVWLPLTDATRENGCMNVLPRSRQMRYPDTLEDFHEIDVADRRALPVLAGSVLAWSQDLYHWSGVVTEEASHPRVSLSLEFQNTSFEALSEPLLDVSAPPPFAERLALIAQQFNNYKHMETVKMPDWAGL